MKTKTPLLMLFFSCASLFGQAPAPQGPPAETVTPNIPGVVAAGTKVQIIKAGFEGTEGPVAMPDGSVIFTNATHLTKIDTDDKVSMFLDNPDLANGLAFDSKGRLIGVMTAPGKTGVAVMYPKGKETVLADKADGKPFGRPNDLVVDKKGGVYFTDPGPNAQQIEQGMIAVKPIVYYLPAGGKPIKIAEGIERPNGIQLSPDEKILYVNNTNGEY